MCKNVSKRDVQMTNNDMKCSLSFVIREMEIYGKPGDIATKYA